MMQVNSSLNMGMQGYQQAKQSADQASAQIAGINSTNGDQAVQLTEEVMNLKVAEVQAKASAQVIQGSLDITGALIDVWV